MEENKRIIDQHTQRKVMYNFDYINSQGNDNDVKKHTDIVLGNGLLSKAVENINELHIASQSKVALKTQKTNLTKTNANNMKQQHFVTLTNPKYKFENLRAQKSNEFTTISKNHKYELKSDIPHELIRQQEYPHNKKIYEQEKKFLNEKINLRIPQISNHSNNSCEALKTNFLHLKYQSCMHQANLSFYIKKQPQMILKSTESCVHNKQGYLDILKQTKNGPSINNYSYNNCKKYIPPLQNNINWEYLKIEQPWSKKNVSFDHKILYPSKKKVGRPSKSSIRANIFKDAYLKPNIRCFLTKPKFRMKDPSYMDKMKLQKNIENWNSLNYIYKPPVICTHYKDIFKKNSFLYRFHDT